MKGCHEIALLDKTLHWETDTSAAEQVTGLSCETCAHQDSSHLPGNAVLHFLRLITHQLKLQITITEAKPAICCFFWKKHQSRSFINSVISSFIKSFVHTYMYSFFSPRTWNICMPQSKPRETFNFEWNSIAFNKREWLQIVRAMGRYCSSKHVHAWGEATNINVYRAELIVKLKLAGSVLACLTQKRAWLFCGIKDDFSAPSDNRCKASNLFKLVFDQSNFWKVFFFYFSKSTVGWVSVKPSM